MRYMMLLFANLLFFCSNPIDAALILGQKGPQIAVTITDLPAPGYALLQSFIQTHTELGFQDQGLSSLAQDSDEIPLIIMNEAHTQALNDAFKLINAFNKPEHFRWHFPNFWTYLLSGYLFPKFKKEILKKAVNLTHYHLIYHFHKNPQPYPAEKDSHGNTDIKTELAPLFQVMKNICAKGGRFLLKTLDLTQGIATYLIKMPKRPANWEALILDHAISALKSSTEIKAIKAESLSTTHLLLQYQKLPSET